ncbi:Uroporphyrinogen-III synthase [Mizuhopecten yessoensis]|uniref:Uroporphyrinogen-III synthase n=2 Tax=Mizuhopecten yessoensis TaxID=6573 RepID=A0A210QQI9_MIZYE|nr:Uroporphyrinogen-III synthase [Mizuhopecten yessoensis]
MMSVEQGSSSCSSESYDAQPKDFGLPPLGCSSQPKHNKDTDTRLVLLLKSGKGDQDEDPYQKLLTNAGFNTVLCPVLTFDFLNLDLYEDQLSKPDEYSAIVFTSQQAVKATEMVLDSLSGEGMQPLDRWTCFVVGQATATEARRLGFLPQGKDSGSAEVLSEIILKDVRPKSKPILYPCGNLKRDTLPKKMKENGVDLHEVTVYRTIPRDDIEKCIHDIVRTEGTPSYMVFFSPSGVEATLPVLESSWFAKDHVKYISIGRTTSQAMSNHLVPVTGVCSHPDPHSLLETIRTDNRPDKP